MAWTFPPEIGAPQPPLYVHFLAQVWQRAHPAHHRHLLLPAEVRHHDEQEELILVTGVCEPNG